MALPTSGLGTCTYKSSVGTYTFSAAMETQSLRGRYHRDAANRTTVYTSWTLTIKDYVVAAPGQTIDTAVQSARNILSEPGGILTYNGKGFSALNINGGPVKDVAWGPLPEELDFRIRGRDRAAVIVWTVTVNLPEMCVTPAYSFAILEMNFDVNWSLDASVYTTRTISGHLIIPQTRTAPGSRTLNDNADNYRSKIVPTVPFGFRRKGSSVKLDASKCRIDFSFTDEEMVRYAPPPGIIEISASHSISGGLPNPQGNQWFGTIRATYEVAKDQTLSNVFVYFMRLVRYRTAAAFSYGTDGSGRQTAQSCFITNFSFEEDIYSRGRSALSASYSFLSGLGSILQASGLWAEPTDADHSVWRASLGNSMFNPSGRGFAGLGFSNSEDVLVDLCSQQTRTLSTKGPPKPPPGNQILNFVNTYPDPDGSWIDYRISAHVEPDDQVVELKPLPPGKVNDQTPPLTVTLQTGGFKTPPDGAKIANNIGAFTPDYPTGKILTTPQQRVQPSLSLYLVGQALRAGYPINPPDLVSIGGVGLVSANRPGREGFRWGVIANCYGVPVVGAVWRQRYVLPQSPQEIGVPLVGVFT